jgi:endonuclease/exonuclease/phosphatase family metal-dependent hydrolase
LNLSVVLRVLHLILILVTFVAYLSPYTRPQEMWFLQFVGMVYPWLLLLHSGFIIMWLWLKKRYYWLSIVVLLVGYTHFNHFVGYALFRATAKNEHIKIMSYNIDNFAHFLRKKDFDKRYTLFETFILKENPDIICLQESFIAHQDYNKLFKKFPCLSSYPYLLHPVEKGIVLLSKYPSTAQGAIPISDGGEPNNANGANFADIELGATRFRLIITHLQSNSVTNRTANLLENPDLSDSDNQEQAKTIVRRVRHASYIRARQAEMLRDYIAKSPYPVIVAGDFNDTPLSYTYQQIADGLQDTFAEKGFGLATTYAGAIPALRIDYILADGKFKVLNFRTPAVTFSDHYPIVAELAWR